MKLLTTMNPKLAKGEAFGYLSAVLHLAPARLSGFNVCPMATAGCIAACLNTAGRGGIFAKGQTTNAIQRARIARTRWYFEDRPAFLAQLRAEIAAHVRRAKRLGLKPAVRLNGTSDIPWERVAPELFSAFPEVQFYDYTKVAKRARSPEALPANYRLTYSLSEDPASHGHARDVLAAGGNVAVVFRSKAVREQRIASGAVMGAYVWPVIDGDLTDLRFTDPPGSIVGLYAKGKARADRSGFVID